jgi:multidrug efflux pump subunit AcrA (membrane-fusion protein)
MKKNSRSTFWLLPLMIVLAGCNGKSQNLSSQQITLLEPVNATVQTAVVKRQDIRGIKTYDAIISPSVMQLNFQRQGVFETYLVSVGDEVKKGQILAEANMESEREELEKLNQQLETLQYNYSTAYLRKEKVLEQYQLESQLLFEQLEGLSGQSYTDQCLLIGKCDHKIRALKLEMEQDTKVFLFEEEHLITKMKSQEENLGKNQIIAPFDGVVMALKQVEEGNSFEMDSPMVALGDLTKLVVHSDYLSQSSLNKVVDYYVLFHGKEYEAEYVPYDKGTYLALEVMGETPVSTFNLAGVENDEVQAGDSGTLVLLTSVKEQVLCLPKDAIYEEQYSTYVYQDENGKRIRTEIEIGESNGVLMEVTKGLREGVKVYVPGGIKQSATIMVKRGDFYNEINVKADISYQKQEMVTMEDNYGELHFEKFEVVIGQKVQQGDVIASVSIKQDGVLLEEKELLLKRLQERMDEKAEEFLEEKRDLTENLRYYHNPKQHKIEEIKIQLKELDFQNSQNDMQRNITELMEEIAEIKEAYELKEIRATSSGKITSLATLIGGEVLNQGFLLAVISSEEDFLLKVNNETGVLRYGQQLQVRNASDSQEKYFRGIVVSPSVQAVTGSLKKSDAYIKIIDAEFADFIGMHFLISGYTKEIKNVLLVEERAVVLEDGETFVYLQNEDKSITKVGFTAGGNNKSYYWVLDGLQENMEIIIQ